MARLARGEVFADDEVAIVHVMNRTVRRCFLLGDDPVTGRTMTIVNSGSMISWFSRPSTSESTCFAKRSCRTTFIWS